MSNDEFNDVLKNLIPEYLANRRQELEKLIQLANDGELAEIKKIGHKLAGNAGSYGLQMLGDIGVKLEESKTIEEVKIYIEEYKKTLKRL